jgi:5-methylcytosine-specific restriction protein A
VGESRCRTHRLERDRTRWTRQGDRRRTAGGDGAARRLRRAVNAQRLGMCSVCCQVFAASDLEVDHVVELADGGQDVDGNVQLLCKPDHVTKSAQGRRARNV